MGKNKMGVGIDPRELWLAGLGVVSLTRKRMAKLYDVLVDEGTEFRDNANQTIESLGNQARNGLNDVKLLVENRAEPLLTRVNAGYDMLKSTVDARMSPVLERFSTTPAKPKTRKVTRTGAKKAAAPGARASAKTTTKSVAKKSPRKTTTVRKSSTKKVVSAPDTRQAA